MTGQEQRVPVVNGEVAEPEGAQALGAYRSDGLCGEHARAVLAQAHEGLQERLAREFQKLRDRTRVTERDLELMVRDCVHEIGRKVLGKLLELEPWLREARNAARWSCPTCGRLAPRAQGAQGEAMAENVRIVTLLGAVDWRAPLFDCRGCRRLFSPR